MRKEDMIRDKLCNNIRIIDSNLTLIEKEYKLENSFGTKGFIDILAKDQYNNYVIIEIKRSQQASREAIHEIMKYASLIKQNLHVKDSEIRLMILSTDWKELIVPFSEYCSHNKYMTEGLKLHIDDNLDITEIEIIEPIDISFIRKLSREHTIFLYENKEKMVRELEKIPSYMNQIRMENYVILQLENHEEERVVFRFALYVVTTIMDIARCIDVLNRGVEEEENKYDLDELIEDYSSEEAAYDEIIGAYSSLYVSQVKCDDLEIGYPEKLMTMNLWKLIKLHRFGFFQKDLRLTDDIIMYECKGLDGLNDSVFYSFTDSRQVAKLKEVKENSLNCLLFNRNWSNILKKIYENIDECGKCSINIIISNLDNIIESILMVLQNDDPLLFPNFELIIDIDDSNKTYIYRGVVHYNGCRVDFDKLNDIFFEGDFFKYFFLRHLNEICSINNDIMSYLGLTYNVEVIQIDGKDSDIKLLKLVDGELEYENINDNQLYIYDFVKENPELIRDLIMECMRLSLGYVN